MDPVRDGSRLYAGGIFPRSTAAREGEFLWFLIPVVPYRKSIEFARYMYERVESAGFF